MKRSLPLLLTFAGGTVVLADYFVESAPLSATSTRLLTWSVLIASFATALGGANILAVHIRNARSRADSRYLSVILIASLLVWLVAGVVSGTSSPVYVFIWQNVYGSLSATLFALNAFFIASAAFRSFRARNIDSVILLAAAIAVMLGRVGLGEYLYSGMPEVADWLMKVPGTAGMRGITVGGALGAITVSARVILGLERGYTVSS